MPPDISSIMVDTKQVDILPIFANFLFDNLTKISKSYFLSLIFHALI